MQRILKRKWELENVLSEEKSNKKLGFDLERERTSGERESDSLFRCRNGGGRDI